MYAHALLQQLSQSCLLALKPTAKGLLNVESLSLDQHVHEAGCKTSLENL